MGDVFDGLPLTFVEGFDPYERLELGEDVDALRCVVANAEGEGVGFELDDGEEFSVGEGGGRDIVEGVVADAFGE